MANLDIIAVALARKYTDESIAGTSGTLVGKSAFEIAQANGFSGSESDWLNSLKGINGKDGADGHSPTITIGTNGHWYIDGVDTGQLATVGTLTIGDFKLLK